MLNHGLDFLILFGFGFGSGFFVLWFIYFISDLFKSSKLSLMYLALYFFCILSGFSFSLLLIWLLAGFFRLFPGGGDGVFYILGVGVGWLSFRLYRLIVSDNL